MTEVPRTGVAIKQRPTRVYYVALTGNFTVQWLFGRRNRDRNHRKPHGGLLVRNTRWMVLLITLALVPVALVGQERPTIALHPFTAGADVAWPYDMKLMQTQTIAEVKAKVDKQYEITEVAPEASASGHAHTYTLDGEILAWHPGNRAERLLVGAGTGRENAEIHFWVTDDTGKKVLEHTETIKAEFWGNAYAGSVGQLAHPFADKIAKRLKEAN